MDLVKSGNSKYDEYEALLLERDMLSKEAGQIWTTYLKTFGQLITENYEEKIECIKCKKTIAYYQNAVNHGGTVDAKAMQEYLSREMAGYYENLKRMTEDNKKAKEAGTSSAYEVKRSKELYRRLAKLIHPDINPETDRSEELQELWQRIRSAYGKNSVKELAELEVLVRKTLKALGLDSTPVEIPDVDERIDEIKKEIEEIKNTEPYSLKFLVEDEEAAKKKREEISKETEEYKKYRKELGDIIVNLIAGGGLQLYA
ncbi:MAG: hypothetical protein IKX06_02340 [Clostridia bacterium]|nr:hypothetical protein [Clostridia bacterium]